MFDEKEANVDRMAAEAHRRYAEILKDVEYMIDDYSERRLSSSVLSKYSFLGWAFLLSY